MKQDELSALLDPEIKSKFVELNDREKSIVRIDEIQMVCRYDDEVQLYLKNREDEITLDYDDEVDAKSDYKKLKKLLRTF